MSEAAEQFLVVGIGASAGGVVALQQFFSNVPADSGSAYVVILHRSPEYESNLAAVLQSVTPLPVVSVSAAVRVAPDHIYVVPPSQHLTMADDTLHVSPNTAPEERRAPIDLFFRTLADSHDGRGVCVILSGSGSDGSMGLKRVKERGGAVFVQNPREAAVADMPRAAIATDLVDEVLPVAEIPARIVVYRAGIGTVAIPEEPRERPEDQQQALREVFAMLRTRTGHDFVNYKRATVLRRIERRITVRSLLDLPAYVGFLRNHPDEIHALLKDLLISVTNFFRDREAFEVLERDVLPRIFSQQAANAQVRVWVAGCATGEEAYSLAMLCAERTIDAPDAVSVQIFATDIDEAAIAHAREGLYTISDLADVSPERLRRFFTKEDDRYRVRRELREMVLFANHNILKDPPFSHLNLVSCRNVLIYLNHTAQERVMETLHFALNPGGFLLLGSSESVDGAGDLFATLSREHHIYQHRGGGARPLPVPEILPALRALRLPPARLTVEADERIRARISGSDLHLRLLEQYASPSIVVTADFELVHVSERAGRYLQLAGEFTADLLRLIRPELRAELRLVLSQAVQRQTTVETSPLPLHIAGHTEQVTIRVRPVLRADDPTQGYLLILFESGMATATGAELVGRFDEPLARQLEDEVTRLKQQLRQSSEQYEYQAEELRATNEELQATIEELRSSTEELETSKEELQSVNEELRTVNQELKVKVEEASIHSTNLQNLVNSAEIGTIFLDLGLHIKLFTPAARALFNLIPADYGRPLADITHRLVDVDVLADAQQVLARLQTIEREVWSSNGGAYVLRVLPYRMGEDRIGGVVITFFDISARVQAEAALRESVGALQLSEEQFRRAIEEAPIPVIMHAEDGAVLQISRSWTELTGYTLDDVPTFDTWLNRAYGRGADAVRTHMHDLFAGTMRTLNVTFEIRTRTGAVRHWSFSASSPGSLRDGRRFIVGMAVDITEQARAEAALRTSEERQAFLLRLSDALRSLGDPLEVQAVVTQTAMGYFNADRCYYCEIEGDDAIIRRDASRPGLPSVAGVYAMRSMPIFQAVIGTGEPFVVQDAQTSDKLDEVLRELCLQLQVISFLDVPVIKDGQLVGVLCITQAAPRAWSPADVELAVETAERTWAAVERARAEAALRQAHDVLEQRVAERTAELASSNQALHDEIAQRSAAEQARQDLQRRLAAAQEEERLRIARDLHDQLGQQITGLQLGLAQVEAAAHGTPAAAMLPPLQALALDLAKEAHRLAVNLRPTALEDVGLLAALEELVAHWSAQSGVAAALLAQGMDQRRLPRPLELALYRVVQEALTNVRRHAAATSVSVIVERRADMVSAIVEDNGRGFDAETAADERPRLGLLGIRERVAQVGGTIEIESSPSSGTTVLVRVPLAGDEPAA